jgi:hypothetical protein
MDNSIFFRHYDCVVEGLLTGIKCIQEDHNWMHPFVNLDTQKVYYECLECNYRITPGILTLNALREELNEVERRVLKDEIDEF